ncbi:MAG: beta-ketoacyl-ACP synthase II [Planctomycetes bacterium]|nr:beta-ketoacyl-ACP synthase II [Planctomycetota bacterium]
MNCPAKRRVVITGLGAITPLGHNPEDYWQALLAGKSGAARITAFDTTGYDVTIGAEVKNFQPGQWMDEREARRMDRFSQFGMASAAQAVKEGNIDFTKLDPKKCGVIMGSGIGGFIEYEEQHNKLLQKGPTRVSPFFIPKLMINAVCGQIAIYYKLNGPNFMVSSACASANHAMGIALRTIQHGEADLVITGGTESAVTVMGLSGFAALKALSNRNNEPEKASRPFDKDRNGFVLGEGCGVLIFEELEHAKKRNAKIYAEVLGFGMNDDGNHITAPDPAGIKPAEAMRLAMEDAGVKPEDVNYVNAHGTSTELNDLTETKAIKIAFGEHARKLAISSTKSMTGHLLGAAGAVELIACVMSIRDNKVHPTINYETPDPNCDLDYVPNKARAMQVNVAISNTFGFGGHNATMVVGKYKP